MPEPSSQRYEAPFGACMSEAARRGAHLMDQLVEATLHSFPSVPCIYQEKNLFLLNRRINACAGRDGPIIFATGCYIRCLTDGYL